jgi:hypothetical protein
MVLRQAIIPDSGVSERPVENPIGIALKARGMGAAAENALISQARILNAPFTGVMAGPIHLKPDSTLGPFGGGLSRDRTSAAESRRVMSHSRNAYVRTPVSAEGVAAGRSEIYDFVFPSSSPEPGGLRGVSEPHLFPSQMARATRRGS